MNRYSDMFFGAFIVSFFYVIGWDSAPTAIDAAAFGIGTVACKVIAWRIPSWN